MATTTLAYVQPDDLAYELDLAKKFTDQVGFLSRDAVTHYAAIGSVIRARENDEPAGFLVFTRSVKSEPRIAQIFQAAIQWDAQRRHHGLALVEQAAVDASAAQAHALQCWCAKDLEANEFWAAAGFTNVGERRGGARRGRTHILWRRPLLLRLDQIQAQQTRQDAPGMRQKHLADLWDLPILDAGGVDSQ